METSAAAIERLGLCLPGRQGLVYAYLWKRGKDIHQRHGLVGFPSHETVDQRWMCDYGTSRGSDLIIDAAVGDAVVSRSLVLWTGESAWAGLRERSMMRDFEPSVGVHLWMDLSAALGIATRSGLGSFSIGARESLYRWDLRGDLG